MFEASGAKRSWVINCTGWSRLAWPLTLTFDLLTWISKILSSSLFVLLFFKTETLRYIIIVHSYDIQKFTGRRTYTGTFCKTVSLFRFYQNRHFYSSLSIKTIPSVNSSHKVECVVKRGIGIIWKIFNATMCIFQMLTLKKEYKSWGHLTPVFKDLSKTFLLNRCLYPFNYKFTSRGNLSDKFFFVNNKDWYSESIVWNSSSVIRPRSWYVLKSCLIGLHSSLLSAFLHENDLEKDFFAAGGEDDGCGRYPDSVKPWFVV